ncbi:hypothetical protein Pla22_06000 [Rubripirellula amarantea]|uniref:Phosphate-selective porin O and P n=1 Tax=Rubripirellula amarantea TaxID=2527999 RepID=A0A5C5WT24_9BACT|nr:hypothetical protein [Rubripirellula amarantea]TWT52972.1 hypothetical protein Pla22_06000 [Rubripirellula amarantea]
MAKLQFLFCLAFAVSICDLSRSEASEQFPLPGLSSVVIEDPDATVIDSVLLESDLSSPNAGQADPFASVGASVAPESPLDDFQEMPVGIGVGYDRGFIIASEEDLRLGTEDFPYRLKINGWGQLRHTVFDSSNGNRDLNQLQLKRARVVLSGNAISTDLLYFVQLDGRSNAADGLRLLDYYFAYDLSHGLWGGTKDALGIKAGLYKIPSSLARQLSGKELEFSDRSMSSIYFDVNRSIAVGLYGKLELLPKPLFWELALFNGLVTGGSDTGSSRALDNNNAFSGRVYCYPTGDWGPGELADFTNHQTLVTRVGAGFAVTTIDRSGFAEFSSLRTVDTGQPISAVLPVDVDSFDVAQYSVDASLKYRGVSLTSEYYFRNLSGFQDATIANLFDHGFWLQAGVFLVPEKFEVLTRWSRVVGNSGTLGQSDRSSDEIAAGAVWYFHGQNAKLTTDATHLNGAAINSSVLDINSGDAGWLFRTQLQFSF